MLGSGDVIAVEIKQVVDLILDERSIATSRVI
jgi:hypothetical protein